MQILCNKVTDAIRETFPADNIRLFLLKYCTKVQSFNIEHGINFLGVTVKFDTGSSL